MKANSVTAFSIRRTLRALVFAASALGFGAASAADYLAMSGSELYRRFCASCHGVEGRGDGPVADSFTVEVPDITLIARRRGGQFPRERIEKIIDGRHIIAAHGSRAMPIWGADLTRAEIGSPDAERAAQTIIRRLADHVEQMQRGSTGSR
ncbi:MAG TPA: cytochrome c [Steroidobacter sp.]|jgi:mono/diheme cytochrome c family protein|nr:cytochrome c [Steroidobacteraceae bacterium]HLS81343.1 cytochrome c [Steroidobacter sp.]